MFANWAAFARKSISTITRHKSGKRYVVPQGIEGAPCYFEALLNT